MAHYLVVAFFAAVLVVLSVIDIRTRRLPNRIVLPAAAIVLAAQITIAPDRALEWVLGAFGAFALLLGAALGWAVAPALVVGFVAAAIAGVVMIARSGWSARKATLPLGPFLAL